MGAIGEAQTVFRIATCDVYIDSGFCIDLMGKSLKKAPKRVPFYIEWTTDFGSNWE
jgi:hypothetical protein